MEHWDEILPVPAAERPHSPRGIREWMKKEDSMLLLAGDFLRFQFVLLAVFSFTNIICALHYFSQTFTTLLPIQQESNTNYINQSIHSCYLEEQEYSNELYGYVSIVEEFQWCGEDDWKPLLGQSMFFVGSACGTLGFGIVADRIGRLHGMVFANMFALIGNVLTAVSQEIVSFSISRFIAGVAADSNFVLMYIIVVEYIKPSLRSKGINLCIGIFYCLTCVVIPWLAVLVGTWRYFLILVAIPHIFVLGYYLVIPESAQWLISKGKAEDAFKCFKRIAKINRTVLTREQIADLRLCCSQYVDSDNSASAIDLFKTPHLRRRMIILILKSMIVTLCFDAISRNVNNLGLSPFIVFSITSLVILPASVTIAYLQDRIGRKATTCLSLLTNGIFTCLAGYALEGLNYNIILSTFVMFVARFGINVAYHSGCQFAIELVPTEVRAQGISLIHVLGYASSFFSVYILYLRKYWKAFPELILGTLQIIGAIFCLLLPETLNKKLPVSLKDGEEFDQKGTVWDFIFQPKKNDNIELHQSYVQYRDKY